MRNAVSLGIRKMTTAITKVMLQNKHPWGMDHWSSALIKHKFTAWHSPCLCQVPYAKATVIQSSGIALSNGLLKLSPGMEEVAAGQTPSLGKALQHYSTKLCTLEHSQTLTTYPRPCNASLQFHVMKTATIQPSPDCCKHLKLEEHKMIVC